MKPGSTAALITPFIPETGKVDIEGTRRLLRYHVEAGTDNLCILGTTGEASVLSMDEREQVLKAAVEEVKGKMTILAGTGAIDPVAIKANTQQAIDIGCDAALVVTPPYVKPPQRCLIKHMTTCADYGLPLVIYNVPGRTGVNFLDENIAIAAQHENVVALKDATGDMSRLEKLKTLVDDDFFLYSGDDSTTLDFVLKGGHGCISVTANIAAKAVYDMVHAARAGRAEEAAEINSSISELHSKLFVESNPIPTKWAAKRLGMIDSAYCRAPLDAMDPKFESELEEVLREVGLL